MKIMKIIIRVDFKMNKISDEYNIWDESAEL